MFKLEYQSIRGAYSTSNHIHTHTGLASTYT